MTYTSKQTYCNLFRMASFARKISRKYNYTVMKSVDALRSSSLHLQRCKYSTEAQTATKQIDEGESTLTINPLKHPDFFQVHNLFTVEDLFNANVHLGHKESSVNDHMLPYIYGSRLGHLIIDLDKTADHLRHALNFAAHIAFREGIILFFLKNARSAYLVDTLAQECGEYAHTKYWRHGTFTNSTNQFKLMTRLPDLCIFFSTKDNTVHDHEAVTHAAKMCIPTVGIVDTNCDPRLVTYPVPGNDDSFSAINLYCTLFRKAIMRGKQARKLIASKNQ